MAFYLLLLKYNLFKFSKVNPTGNFKSLKINYSMQNSICFHNKSSNHEHVKMV